MPTLGEISKAINATVKGDDFCIVESVASCNKAKKNQLTYVVSKKHLEALKNTKASAVIISSSLLEYCPTNALVVNDVYLAFAKATHLFKHNNTLAQGIHSSAQINNTTIGENCNIGQNTVVGVDCSIGSNVVIEDNVVIGKNTHIASNVTVLNNCQIGDNVVISPGVVIGSEGFGNARDENKKWHSIAHLGKVIIGNNITIGANTTIDRGTLEDTQIHDGVRLDNLIHIAHNVVVGQDTAIAASTGIAGSTRIGKRCMIGGMVGIVGHLNICNDVIIKAKSTVDKDIAKPGVYTGIVPLMSHKTWKNVGIWLIKLDKIAKHLNIKLKNLKGK